MIIIEGPDGAGKTSLVLRLSMDLKVPIMPKVVDSNTTAMVDLKTWVEGNLATGLQRRIFDRHRLISEPIYGPVIRGYMEPGFDDFFWLNTHHAKLHWLKPLVIFCLPPLDIVKKNIENDAENRVVAKDIELIYWLYHNMAAQWPLYKLMWNYTRDTSGEVSTYNWLKQDIQHWLWSKGLY